MSVIYRLYLGSGGEKVIASSNRITSDSTGYQVFMERNELN